MKFLHLQYVCVMCSSILNKQIAKSSLHKTKREISNKNHRKHICGAEVQNTYKAFATIPEVSVPHVSTTCQYHMSGRKVAVLC